MEPVHVSTSSKALFNKVRRIVPPLLERFHKGSSPLDSSEHCLNLMELVANNGI